VHFILFFARRLQDITTSSPARTFSNSNNPPTTSTSLIMAGKSGVTFKVARIIQALFLVVLVGMTAHIVRLAGQGAGAMIIAMLSLACLAAAYCLLTLFLYMDHYVPLNVVTVLELAFLIAFIVITTLTGERVAVYECETEYENVSERRCSVGWCSRLLT
jgi:hypothetical protein